MNKTSNHKMQASLELTIEEQKLQQLFQAAVVDEPSPAISQRVAHMAAQHQVKHQRRQNRRRVARRSLALCGAVALVFFAIRATPFIMAELLISRVEAAVGKVQSAHVKTWKILVNGERVRTGETWQEGRLHRFENWPEVSTGLRREVRIFRNGKMWTYEPESNKVTLKRQESPYGARNVDLTGSGLLRELTSVSATRTSMSVTTEHTNANGQPARRVRIKTTGRHESYDIVMLVEDRTDLPISLELGVLHEQSGRKSTTVMEFDFNKPLSAKLFEPNFPQTTRLLDYDKGEAEWRKRLAKGIFSRRVGERTIVIRDVRANKEGHIFVLYTAGRKLIGAPFGELTKQGFMDLTDWTIDGWRDNRGTLYNRPQYSPFVPTREIQFNLANPQPNGFVYNGEKLEGLWLIPRKPQRSWRPIQITLTLRINPRPWQPLKNHEHNKTRERRTVTFTIPVAVRESHLVPDYMRYMQQGPGSDEEVLSAQFRVRHPFEQTVAH
jgi:outer membrane lipoprotein-sorting protein